LPRSTLFLSNRSGRQTVAVNDHPALTAPARAIPDEDDRWLTPGVTGIGLASLLADAGHEVPTALLPSLLTGTLRAPAAALGVIEGVSDALAGLARLGGGALADDPERRRVSAVGGYTTTAELSAALAAATSVCTKAASCGACPRRGRCRTVPAVEVMRLVSVGGVTSSRASLPGRMLESAPPEQQL
jgi:hypothetical protein